MKSEQEFIPFSQRAVIMAWTKVISDAINVKLQRIIVIENIESSEHVFLLKRWSPEKLNL